MRRLEIDYAFSPFRTEVQPVSDQGWWWEKDSGDFGPARFFASGQSSVGDVWKLAGRRRDAFRHPRIQRLQERAHHQVSINRVQRRSEVGGLLRGEWSEEVRPGRDDVDSRPGRRIEVALSRRIGVNQRSASI